jgi:GNAT superfamily N-acetyltransferase
MLVAVVRRGLCKIVVFQVEIMNFSVRSAQADDADAVGELSTEFAEELRNLGDTTGSQFSSDVYLRDGFGERPAFAGLVAVAEETVIGYLLYHYGYDTDSASRIMYVLDLYVHSSARGHGVGRSLMKSAARLCREEGVKSLLWSVFEQNDVAKRFYQKLGAQFITNLESMSARADQL